MYASNNKSKQQMKVTFDIAKDNLTFIYTI